MELLEFKPLYMERVWGGRSLEAKFNRALPQDKLIGESWEIVDRDQEQSIVVSRSLAGVTIRELLLKSANLILGPGRDGNRRFPILVKWLDCQDRLSLQVHPPKETAHLMGGEAKTENWYLADCKDDASLLVGLKEGVTQKQFTHALSQKNLIDCVNRFSVNIGDSILVKSGLIHAIEAGNLILEVQQNSNTTYRVYDWERIGLNGAPRQLQIKESLQSITFKEHKPELKRAVEGDQILADCSEFRIRKFQLRRGSTNLQLPAHECARIIHVIKGQLIDTFSGKVLKKGKNYLQAYVTGIQLKAESAAIVLVTDQF